MDRGGFNSWSILSTVITSKKNKNVFPLLTQTCHLQIKLNKRDESNEISLEWFSEKKNFEQTSCVSLMDSFDLLQIKGIVYTLIFWQDSERKTTLSNKRTLLCLELFTYARKLSQTEMIINYAGLICVCFRSPKCLKARAIVKKDIRKVSFVDQRKRSQQFKPAKERRKVLRRYNSNKRIIVTLVRQSRGHLDAGGIFDCGRRLP